ILAQISWFWLPALAFRCQREQTVSNDKAGFESISNRYTARTPVEGDHPVSQNISPDQTCVRSLFGEIDRNYANGVKWSQIGARKTYGASMFSAGVRGTDCCYLSPIIGVKELAVVRKDLADYRDRSPGIQK